MLIALVTSMQCVTFISNVLDEIVFGGTALYRHILACGVSDIDVHLSPHE